MANVVSSFSDFGEGQDEVAMIVASNNANLLLKFVTSP